MKKVIGCENCGWVPVAESTLCVDCQEAFRIKLENSGAKLEELRLQLRLQRRLLRHVFEEYQSVIKKERGKL